MTIYENSDEGFLENIGIVQIMCASCFTVLVFRDKEREKLIEQLKELGWSSNKTTESFCPECNKNNNNS